MFTRRHPYLFFLLVSFSIFTVLVLGSMTMAVWISGGSGDFGGEAVGVVEIEGRPPIVHGTERMLQSLIAGMIAGKQSG